MRKPPLLIAHIAAYDHYDGSDAGFYPGQFKNARKHGWGWEIANFKPFKGTYYGYVELGGHEMDLSKLGGRPGDDSVSGVTVIWTAPIRHQSGRMVVGWYENATVYRKALDRPGPLLRKRTRKDKPMTYRITAAEADGHLLAPDQRFMRLPPRRKDERGTPGQRPIFYIDQHAESAELAQRLRQVVQSQRQVALQPEQPEVRKRAGGNRSDDAEQRARVERSAIARVTEHYQAQGFDVTDRQQDCCGYDLEFRQADVLLCVEVKGLSGSEINVEFTRNEWETIQRQQKGRFDEGELRIAVVTEALSGRPGFHEYAWHQKSKRGQWLTHRGARLKIQPIESARGSG